MTDPADAADEADEIDIDAVVEETIEFLTVRREGDDWVGDAPEWFGERLFGGFVLGQAVHAATQTTPDGRRIHSLHGYFLRPVVAGRPLTYRVVPLREGRTLTTSQLEAVQDGNAVFTMMCSFASDTGGYEYELKTAEPVPSPEGLPVEVGPGPWEVAEVGPTAPAADGTRTSTRRAWFRIVSRLPDDANLHAALIAFLTDMTGTGGRPLHLDGDVTGMISIDHAAWFHRPLRADEWAFYDVHSLVNTGGRGVLRGAVLGPDGRLGASVAQEMILRPYG
jgi:acyl-CoA thioesterase-2